MNDVFRFWKANRQIVLHGTAIFNFTYCVYVFYYLPNKLPGKHTAVLMSLSQNMLIAVIGRAAVLHNR